jgi:hypothetical protein
MEPTLKHLCVWGQKGEIIAWRCSKKEKRAIRNGTYRDEETAALASDTLARKLMANGEQKYSLNFPDDWNLRETNLLQIRRIEL